MGMEKPVNTSPVVDEMLLDVATEIELTDHDREIAERRYGRLKQHLERPKSPLRKYLVNTAAQLYPQGSMSIGTTIVSGDDDDRYDVDAIVEIDVPPEWSPEDVRNNLADALEGFPGADIELCTRCVQLQFPNMHMDVTILDPKKDANRPRQGYIFHTPDKGTHGRVPSNPYGFSHWYRGIVTVNTGFAKALASRRGVRQQARLQETIMEKIYASEQTPLAPAIPPRLDSEQAVALKLLKRRLNIAYRNKEVRRPPSIYFTKHSADVGSVETGLTDQLIALAYFTSQKLRQCLMTGTKPDERNPMFDEDRINDRWPVTREDMSTCIDALDDLAVSLAQAKSMSVGNIVKLFARLFGERISSRAYEVLAKRYENANLSTKELGFERRSGTVLSSAAIASPNIAHATAPRQNFHWSEREGIGDKAATMLKALWKALA